MISHRERAEQIVRKVHGELIVMPPMAGWESKRNFAELSFVDNIAKSFAEVEKETRQDLIKRVVPLSLSGQRLINDTLERAAKLAHELGIPSNGDDRTYDKAREIAKAIRAMKKEPGLGMK